MADAVSNPESMVSLGSQILNFLYFSSILSYARELWLTIYHVCSMLGLLECNLHP